MSFPVPLHHRYLFIPWLIVVAFFLAMLSVGADAEEFGRVEERTFVAQYDGSEQKYVVVYPKSFGPHKLIDVLIALHGAGSDRWQFVRDPRDECRAARDVAAEQGMLYLSPDYRAPVSWMGPAAEADLLQIIANLRLNFRIGRIFLCGGSMGGSAALTFAALHPERINGVASMNGTANFLEFENYQEDIARSFGGTKSEVPQEYRKRSAELWPEKLTMPIGLTVSGRDTAVPPDSVRRLASKLKSHSQPVKLIDRPQRGHDTTYDDARSILEFAIQRQPVPDGLVVLTFDDRARSWSTNVAPILKQHGFNATFYVSDSEDFGYHGDDEFWLSWEEVRGLHDDGFEIGNHSQTHDNFATIDKQKMATELEGIEQSMRRLGIPRPVSFAYPGAAHGLEAVDALAEFGYPLARRGIYPEFPDALGSSRGPLYDPAEDHPLLIPGTYLWSSPFKAGSTSDLKIYRNGGSDLGSTFAEFVETVKLAKDGRIVVLIFHGVPDYYSHCSTDVKQFKQCMQHLADQNCQVIAVRDLLRYVDPNRRPADPYAPIERRIAKARE